ncbi:MAG: HAMP domain-containing histidine kinase [Bacteroidales bacterium]|nr:HAMP domain-containing histidine kinase [Bacteroidales bacterium]MBD5217672.1 HAMP domain-containing histidine kinase [Bacteroidales bacterium]MBD5221549.1 HAMP domain-containing histidine kinase [Bacteroidales bacterium]
MKKSTIWLLTAVMAITFGTLLYFQINYLENMVKMREAQFSENVMRSVSATSSHLEKIETLHFLEDEANAIGYNFYDNDEGSVIPVETDSLPTTLILPESEIADTRYPAMLRYPSPVSDIGSRYQKLQQVILEQFLYQKGLLNEVIITIMRDANSRPLLERADSTVIRQYLSTELASNGVKVPFTFAITDSKDHILYSTEGFSGQDEHDVYEQKLFPNSNADYTLMVEFPTKKNYIFSTVRFVIPSLAFTLILLVVFLYTIAVAFRQKKLTEMKTDFINNMTHELKTPISTISLAGQMLNDDSVMKSPTTLKHLSSVITEESKRLRFQVEKVLQMSVFDKDSASALRITEVSANEVIANIVRTFTIKVEKYGGKIKCEFDATRDTVLVDEMHFTNVIFNLLDNAVKYRREDVEPDFCISTRDVSKDRLEIRVSDNGIGIRKDDLKRIFDKFYRVSTGNLHDVKGFGLGLAYVKKMVTLFGGNITVESEPGEGTTFIITLPLSGSNSK